MSGKLRKSIWTIAIIAADLIVLGLVGAWLWPYPISIGWMWSRSGAQSSWSPSASQSVVGVAIDPAAVVGAPPSIAAVCADSRGDVWCGTTGSGLWRLGATDGKWTHMTGPWGDSGVTSLAMDAAGRMWVGHDNAGLSIYNGQWRHYDLTNSPVAPHVFAIAACPRDNDVWVASDLALARYSYGNDTWTSIDRTTGTLPAWPISSLAFDASGNLLAGTPADGVLLASASDEYSAWRQITGPDLMPTTPTGDGLPSSEINAVLAARDGTLFAATPLGLARSGDGGSTWNYLRGANLARHVDQNYMHVGTRPPLRTPAVAVVAAPAVVWPRLPLLADWVSAMSQDASGRLWLGYAGAGYECRGTDFMSSSSPRPSVGGPQYVSSIASVSGAGGASILVSGRDGIAGICNLESARGPWPTTQPVAASSPKAAAPLPATAAVPNVSDLNAMRQRVAALPKPTSRPAATAEYLGDDWTTGGDWPGRYGRCLVDLCLSPNRKNTVAGGYDVTFLPGPYISNGHVDYGNRPADVPVNVNWPYFGRGTRSLGWVGDGTTGDDDFPSTMQGPDLYLGVRVPEGAHAISLYFYTGRDPRDDAAAAQRDYVIRVKKGADIAPNAQWKVNSAQDLIPVEVSPSLAWARVNGFVDCGVYERFAVHGRGIWWFKIDRNFSDSTHLQGVFVDKLGGTVTAGKWPMLNTNPVSTTMPADAAGASAPGAAAAYALWTTLDAAKDSPGYAVVEMPYRAAAYRAAAAAGVSEQWLANWRAALHAWTDDDKSAFRTAMGFAPPGIGTQP
jgi:hypothetical protein